MSILELLEIHPDSLVQHTLIVGTTGSGKTQTTLNIIHDLWEKYRIPFLIIESAKCEYRRLIRTEYLWEDTPLRVYTLGNETISPIRINPFELLTGVRVEDHIRYLASCFEAALPSDIGSLPSILERSLRNVYLNKNWHYNSIYLGEKSVRFPTMQDFIREVETLIKTEYSELSRARDEILSVLAVRLRPFTEGSKGFLLNTEYSSPSIEVLFKCPVILEMDSLHTPDKALISLFLLNFLREHCKSRAITNSSETKLRHITVIEEAHNLLAEVSSASATTVSNTRYEAVQAFCNLLAEIRAYGEGIIVVDQRPSKLASDAIANTNIKIIHRLVESLDREVVCRSVLSAGDDSEKICRLNQGEAMVSTPTMQRLVKRDIPLYDKKFTNKNTSDNSATVSDSDLKLYLRRRNILQLPYPNSGCLWCSRPCSYLKFSEEFIKNNKEILGIRPEGNLWFILLCYLLETKLTSNQFAKSIDIKRDTIWCIFVHWVIHKADRPPEEIIRRCRVYLQSRYSTEKPTSDKELQS